MADYPSYRYHATEEPRIVQDADEEKALGAGWADSPAAFAPSDADTEAEIELSAEDDAPAPAKAKGKGKK